MEALSKVAMVLVLVSILALTGCAEQASRSSPNLKYSGFLEDYSGLQPGPRGAQVYVRPEADFSRYDKIMIDPVVIRLTPEAQGTLPPDIRENMAEDFHASLKTALQEKYTIVDSPGPGVLRLRTAITDITPEQSVGVTGRATGPGMSVAKPGEEADVVIAVGNATMEMEVSDAESSERLAAAVDRKGGALGSEGPKRSELKAVFDYWAQRVRDRLD